ncbi:hypothetical protein MHTCC0001_09100 [Flavobacteriaceae bacterium MHTCC 0001]
MKKIVAILGIILVIIACKNEPKASQTELKDDLERITDSVDHLEASYEDIDTVPEPKTAKQTKEELDAKGFKVLYDIDPVKKDTFLMQQYFLAFLKKGPIRGQNEEEAEILQKKHLDHLTKMYELGYADISGPFGDDGDIRGITIYNVPTLKMADSLANSDPMVKAGRLEIEIHPWWAAKGFPLR